MTIAQAPLCVECKHFREYEPDKFACDAFPNGIPEKIVFGEVSHRDNVKGDQGIKFEKGQPQELPPE